METIAWDNGAVRFCDQTRLPREEISIVTSDYRRIADGIRRLEIRGAPAIGIAAAFGAVLAVSPSRVSAGNPRAELESAFAVLAATRPTAVNLFGAIARMRRAAGRAAPDQLYDALLREALAIRDEEIAACVAMAAHGSSLILPGSSILTHCNTGSLATAGEGTALGAIIAAHRQGKVVRVYADETRPLLQGARLTVWELQRAGVETLLITDSTAGTVMARGLVQCVFVGADRIAANGDTANKVGTYSLAVLAGRHLVPFVVVAPTSTFDLRTPTGDGIPVEERPPEEVTHFAGIPVAPPGTRAFSPAFDVTPNELISAIVTEKGILRPPFADSIGRLLTSGEAPT